LLGRAESFERFRGGMPAGGQEGKQMRSIKLKVVISYLALVFLVMLLSGSFMLMRTYAQQSQSAEDDLSRYADRLGDQVVAHNEEQDFQDAIVQSYAASFGLEGNILNASGKTIASTVDQAAVYADSSILSAMNGTAKMNQSTLDGARWFNYARPVRGDDGHVKYIIFTRMDAQPMYTALFDQSVTLVFTVLIALVLIALLGAAFAGTLTGPIIKLTKRSKEMAEGRLSEELPVYGRDEIGQLTESFNHMARELAKSMATINSEKNKLEIIQHNMTDGVLAYDSDAALLHANIAALDLLGINDISKVPFAEMMSLLSSPVTDFNGLSKGADLPDTTFEAGGKFVSASFTPYFGNFGAAEGIVIVLQDITRHKKLDDMRKEFVANVSHEIRTPITTIKSYAETLLEGALDNRETAENFLRVIDSEADRMTLLVTDLLELSRFDSKQMEMQMQRTDLDLIIRNSIKQNEVLANKKSQRIIYADGSEGRFFIMADPARINQVLNNIISNAIKYSGEDGEITVRLEEAPKNYRVYIKDDGMGIPKEDIGRIFERFYRVDKARSRAMGGTGLGLAIAKEIMDAHGGRITAASEVGKGTTMILRFSKAGVA